MNRALEASNKNPYLIKRVVLSSISDEIQLDENLEPPFVRVRDTNSQYLELDNSQNDPANNPSSTNIILERSLPRVNRLRVVFFTFRNQAPNINPRNNTFTFTRLSTGITYTIVLPEINFTGLARYTYLVNNMNTAVGAGVFSATAHPTYINTYIITDIGGSFWWDAASSGVQKGKFLWGFNSSNTGPGNANVGFTLNSFNEAYSRYIDISSFELTQYTKIDIGGVHVPAEVLFRQYLTDVAYGQLVFTGFTQSPSLNYDRSRSITSVDLTFLDEFGELYYVPTVAWANSVVTIVLIADM